MLILDTVSKSVSKKISGLDFLVKVEPFLIKFYISK